MVLPSTVTKLLKLIFGDEDVWELDRSCNHVTTIIGEPFWLKNNKEAYPKLLAHTSFLVSH
jgi:hypothetical protein